MSNYPPSGWQDRARGFAWTVLFVVIALTFAANMLTAIAPTIITVLLVSSLVYAGVLVARYRRSRW